MKLGEYIKRIGKTGTQAAKELQVSASTVSRWASGKTIPGPADMRNIAQWSAGTVTPNDFYSEPAA